MERKREGDAERTKGKKQRKIKKIIIANKDWFLFLGPSLARPLSTHQGQKTLQ